jgi:type VI protein secretion system component VasK
MFKDESQEPHISFNVQPIPGDFTSVTLTLDGPPVRSTVGGNLGSGRIDWPGAQHEAKLTAGQAGQEGMIAGPFSGPWAVFQLFGAADDWARVGSTVNVTWNLAARRGTGASAGAKVVVQILAAGPEATVLRRGSLSGFDVCSGDIAR